MDDTAIADAAVAAGEQPVTTESALATTSTDGTVQKVRKTKVIKRKRRPARPQKDPSTFKTEPPP